MPTITLPTLHKGQVEAWRGFTRFTAMPCGRRWGKTTLDMTVTCDGAAKGELIGIFAPEHKITTELFREAVDILAPIKKQSSMTAGVIRTHSGGRIDFWTLENERAGRSRKYHKVIIDEAAFTKPNMMDIWERSIKPTLLDYGGTALVTSSTNGINPDNFFWQVCNNPKHGFSKYHAPTHSNPHLLKEELDKLERDNAPLVYKQEYLAEFVDWSGDAFFSQDSLLTEAREPYPDPNRCDTVFAVVDTAVKTGKEHDGTAVTYFAKDFIGPKKLYVLDWDIVQIQGSMLDVWLPQVFQNLEFLAAKHKARRGSAGAFIEDKNSGSILVQQCERHNWPGQAIDSVLTSVGKDERAISVSGYVHRREVGITETAFHRVSSYKGTSRNHFLAQVCGFHLGVKDQQDDLLDTFTYGVSIALGNQVGI